MTPEPSASPPSVPAVFVPPSLFRRLASMLYEWVILFAVLALVFLLPHILLGAFAETKAPHWLVKAHFVLVLMLYFVWFWRHGGQTLAMKTWRLRLTDAHGGPLSTGKALLRFLLAWPSALLFGLGFFWAIFDSRRQFLHDRLAGTRIEALPY
ncbi:MAG: RDD family protein [Betaproteobacteria bacterium]|nr:RDD family protein [Betaproteobacteria bacterium]